MIRCEADPSGILKAAILSELTGQLPSLRSPCEQPDLFSLSEELDAGHYSLRSLREELTARTGNDHSWLDHYPGRRLAVMILFNLRNRSHNCGNVIFAALAEALKYGPAYCICGRGRASSIFRHRSREVTGICSPAPGSITIQPIYCCENSNSVTLRSV